MSSRPGTGYYYRIRAVDTSGNVSSWITTASATSREEPDRVASATGTLEKQNRQTIASINTTFETITTSTDHDFQTGQLVTYDANGNTAIGGLTDGAQYWVRVEAADNIWLLDTENGDPVGLSGSLTGTQYLHGSIVSVSWTDVSDGASYHAILQDGGDFYLKKGIDDGTEKWVFEGVVYGTWTAGVRTVDEYGNVSTTRTAIADVTIS